jgi:hypothetical protein
MEANPDVEPDLVTIESINDRQVSLSVLQATGEIACFIVPTTPLIKRPEINEQPSEASE